MEMPLALLVLAMLVMLLGARGAVTPPPQPPQLQLALAKAFDSQVHSASPSAL
jgi:hypothetical protein